jgi:hypothetical protein
MKIISNIEDWTISEGKNSLYQPGEYVNVTGQMIKDKKLQIYSHHWNVMREASRSYMSTGEFSSSMLGKNLDSTLFYIKLKKSGIKWTEGLPVFINCILNKDISARLIRFDMKTVDKLPPGPELKIFLEDDREIYDKSLYDVLRNGKFLRGNEKFIMNSDGENVEKFESGKYFPRGYNYELSKKLKTSIIDIYEESKKFDTDDCLSVRLNDLAKQKEDLPEETLEIVAEKISKIVGAHVEVKDSQFRMPWFSVKGPDQTSDSPFTQKHTAEPFFTYEQAEKHIEFIKDMSKKERLPFDVKNIKVEKCNEYQAYRLTFAQLIEYAKIFGLDFNLEEFIEKNKGGIAATKFGIKK